MPRYPRKPENRGLPARWQRYHGAYWYRVKPGQEAAWDGKTRFRLGTTLPEAYKTWSERIGKVENIKNIGQLLERYALKVLPKKSPKAQADNARSIVRLKKFCGHMTLGGFKPQHAYQYVALRSEKYWAVLLGGEEVQTPDNKPYEGQKPRLRGGVTSAHRDIEVLSHAFTKAVEWGEIDRHPFKGEIRLEGEPPRDRYVEDWETAELLNLPQGHQRKGSTTMLQAYCRLKLSTGMARSDMLRLNPAVHFKADGIHVQRHKTGKRTVFEWTPERFNAVLFALDARPVDISPHLFCNRRGEGYIDEATGTCDGFDSMWQRFMSRLLKETKITERFHEHDLRAKVGSDAKNLDEARKKLQHKDSRTTLAVYRRKPERA